MNGAADSLIVTLARATVEITAAPTLNEALDRIPRLARDLVQAHQAVASLTTDAALRQTIKSISLSDKYAGWRGYDEPTDGSGIYRGVADSNIPMRLGQANLEHHPAWRGFGPERVRRYTEATQHAARRAADLTQRLLAFSRRQALPPEEIDGELGRARPSAFICRATRRRSNHQAPTQSGI